MRSISAFTLAMTILTAAAVAQTNVSTDGFKVKVNGQDFAFKGMNYSPVPIANHPQYAPNGDYFVNAFSNVWGYDIEKMREAGVNTIKLYAGNPGLNAGAPGTGGNWAPFLNTLWNNGDRPIRVMMTSFVQGGDIAAGGAAFQQYKTDWTNLVASTASHPAVLGYTLGNEIYSPSVNNNPTFWQNYGELLDLAHNTAAAQGKDPLITTAINDALVTIAPYGDTWEPIVRGEQSGHLDNLDAWAINIYRGAEFGSAGNNAFDQYQTLMNQLGKQKPMIVGEYGIPHSTRPDGVYGNSNTANPVELGNGQTWITGVPNNGDPAAFMTRMLDTLYNDHLDDGADQVAVGGYVFSYTDEYWKGDPGNPTPPSQHLGGPNGDFLGSAFPGGYWDEAWFGLTTSLDASYYTNNQLPVTRTFYPAFHAIQDHFDDTSHFGAELYIAVPEPSTLLLLGLATSVLLMRKRGR